MTGKHQKRPKQTRWRTWQLNIAGFASQLWAKVKKLLMGHAATIIKVLTAFVLWGLAFELVWEIWVAGQKVLSTLPSNFWPTLVNASNVNRLGLIFQAMGLVTVLPEISKRLNKERWERLFHTASEKSQGFQLRFRDTLLVSPWFWIKTRGGLGLVNLISRGLAVVYTLIGILPIFWNRILNKGILPGAGLILFVLIMDICWIVMTWMDVTTGLENHPSNMDFRFLYAFLNFGLLPSIFFFVPVALLVLLVTRTLREIASNPLEAILTKATFPFVLFGTGLEFAATFMA